MNTKTRIGIIIGIAVLLVVIFTLSKKTTPYVSVISDDQPAPISSDNLAYTYSSTTKGFLIKYPADFNIDESYSYTMDSGKNISGVKFTIPATLSVGTNLGSDSYISVEQIKKSTAASTCVASDFLSLDRGATVHSLTEGTVIYSVASSTGAGAGNRYEETVYAIPGSNPCIALRYFVHYGVIENYPKDTTKEFNKQALLAQFDSMRRTLHILVQVAPEAVHTSTHPVVGEGAHCGGNMSNAPECAPGYYCVPSSVSKLPFGDVGGICTKK